jgi:DNA polymerase bacteriophage-type
MTSIMEVCANTLRGLFIAPPGKKLVVSDLKNIEGRILPWLAGEEWKLQAFREYDAGTGPDIYVLAYAKAFRILVEHVTKSMRQIGKVMELSMGYGGGVGAYLNMAAVYGLDLTAMADAAWDVIPDDVKQEAEGLTNYALSKGHKLFGLERKVYVACESLKIMWRRAHPAITNRCRERCTGPCHHNGLWSNYQKAAITAVNQPGTVYTIGRCSFLKDGNWLRVLLPSGRELSYPSPLHDAEERVLSYMGMHQYTRKWSRISTYGGKLTENIDQATARDVLARAMPRVDAAGYQIVLTVHDELITEAPDTDDFSAEHLSALLAQGETWTVGLPLAADGFEGYRYGKKT